MNLIRLLAAAKDAREGKHSPAVIEKFDEALIETLGLPKRENRFRLLTMSIAVGILYVFTIVTGCIAIGASLKLIDLDQTSFNLVWGVFGTGFFLGIVGPVLRSIWTQSKAEPPA